MSLPCAGCVGRVIGAPIVVWMLGVRFTFNGGVTVRRWVCVVCILHEDAGAFAASAANGYEGGKGW